MRKIVGLLGLLMIFHTGATVWAYSEPTFLHLDSAYDQELRYDAGADKTITPTKVIRWIMSLNDPQTAHPPSPIDFQPIVRAHDGQVKFIAAIAYKF